MSAASADPLERTPLCELHLELGAKMVPFAGYAMPVQYPLGVLKEHLHTRARAGLFDVSHMGQASLFGPDHQTTAAALETLVPADILNLQPGRQRYTQLLNEEGGIVDDLMVTRSADPAEDGKLLLVLNASRKEVDYEYMSGRLPDSVRLHPIRDRALLALQGPEAAAALARQSPQAPTLRFMGALATAVAAFECHVSRSGYTGEDGFEISVAADQAIDLARLLLAEEGVQPIGLGARDSLRLEAGLSLYGHELDEMTSPVEADLSWSIPKRRREAGGFPGWDRIQRELRDGPARLRVGIKPEGRAPARDGTEVLEPSGARIGIVTSGGFGPTVNGPIAMGYVDTAYARPGTPVELMVRGKSQPARIVDLPFVPHRYLR
ncbi:MAG: glycine cleavage system aminomethyltransferase GcvT [Hyphomicrobiaceae bacterium]|nr:glycine cleavage system aminomethyltransferase GcvT [Hyphomicrobiaceae bacterium]